MWLHGGLNWYIIKSEDIVLSIIYTYPDITYLFIYLLSQYNMNFK